MRRELSKRRRAAVLAGGVAAMSGTIPVAHGHHVAVAFILAFEVVLLAFSLRLLHESKHEC